VGELRLVLTDCDLVIAERDLRVGFVDTIVERVPVVVDVNLADELEEVEKLGLRPEADTAVLPIIIVALIGISPVVLTLVAADEFEFLEEGVAVALVEGR